jgi:alkanesulfonate monooxygenase SsuD/methylene tetrahydromethanopterin reductase-like flavin-dependent oxidoreductase (luciferase family)
MDVGVLHIPVRLDQSGDLCRRAEELGIDWMGIADSPHIFGSLYATMQHGFSLTDKIKLGPLVTNPVTRHKSVHAATFEAFEQLYPRRSFFGVAAGDSAVHSVGLHPGKPTDVANLADAVRSACGPELPIVTAVGGPTAARAVSSSSDIVLLGCGFDVGEAQRLCAQLPSGRQRRRWIYVPAYLVPDAADVAAARAAVRAPVVSFSRHALFGDLRAKGVPSPLVDGLKAMYAQYAFAQHSKLGAANANLLADRPAESDYLFRRFALVATPEEAAERVIDFAAQIGDFDIFLGTLVPDVDSHLELVAGRFKDRLSALA